MRAATALSLAALAAADLAIDLSALTPPPTTIPPFGNATAPDGSTVGVTTASLLVDGEPALWAMGEAQFSRLDPARWRTTLLQMKSGGLQVVGSYVFWSHISEAPDAYDFSGARNLSLFVDTAAECGLNVFIRMGPWAHGEERYGGFPSWLVDIPGIRLRDRTDAVYMGHVKTLYGQIAAQLSGRYFADGGPIIGIQVENEFGGSYEYLLDLKAYAIDAGVNVPLITKTGWPAAAFPQDSLLPLEGGYPDSFWDRELAPVTGNAGVYLFSTGGGVAGYPLLGVELGGGMTPAYHRRIALNASDMTAAHLVAAGSGYALMGSYVYAGSTHPLLSDGNTTQESQATGYPNDLPCRTYDFMAPIAEAGIVHGHYHGLRRLYLALREWGALLAAAPARLPAVVPHGWNDTATVRWAARAINGSGMLFVNNYARDATSPGAPRADQPGVAFALALPGGATLRIPRAGSFTLASYASLIVPFNIPAVPRLLNGGMRIIYALGAVPVTTLTDDGAGGALLFLADASASGAPAEVGVATPAGTALAACGAAATCTAAAGGAEVWITAITPSRAPAATFTTPAGRVAVVLLSAADGAAAHKFRLAGAPRVALGDAPTLDALLADDAAGALRVRDLRAPGAPAGPSLWLVPPPARVAVGGGGPVLAPTADGVFARFDLPPPPAAPYATAAVTPLAPPSVPPPVGKGSGGVAQAPSADGSLGVFAAAAGVWAVDLSAPAPPPPPGAVAAGVELHLEIDFIGDIARLYAADPRGNASASRPIADHFFNGLPMRVPLRAGTWAARLFLFILPLRADAPVFLEVPWPAVTGPGNTSVALNGVRVVQVADVALDAAA